VRLDLFLKTSRLVKRRTVAQDMCEAGRVLVNKTAAKPAKEVKPGDLVTLTYATRIIDLEVLGLPEKGSKALPIEIYRVVSQTRIKEQDLWNESPL